MKPLLIVLLLAYQAATQELSSTLHSTVYGVQIAFVDEMVVFTCVVKGSNSMSWTSDEYIGSGQRLSLSSGQLVNHSIPAIGNDQTVAVLVNVTTGTELVIISELHIRVQSSFPLASVQCVNGSTNMITSTSFLLVEASRVTCDREAVCSGRTVTCTCITGNSDSLAWTSNGNTLSFTSTDAVPMRQNVSGSNQFAVLTENSDVNGIRVIMSNFTINVSSDVSDIILTCENVDHAITEPIIIPVIPYENCVVNPTVTSSDPRRVTSTDPENEIAPAKNSSGGRIATVVILIILSLMIVLAILSAIIIVTYMVRHRRLQVRLEESGQEMNSLKEEKQRLHERTETLNQELQSKNTEIGEKETELWHLKSDIMDKERGDRESVKQLKEQMKQKDAEIMQWKDEVDLKQKELYDKDTQLATERARLLEELTQKMNKDLKDALEKMESNMNSEHAESLKAIKDIAEEGIETVLSEGMSVEKLETLKGHMREEIDTTSRYFESLMKGEIKKVLTQKGEGEKASEDKKVHTGE